MWKRDARLSHLLGRRAVPAVAVLMILSFVLMAAALVQIARDQDARAAVRGERFVDAILRDKRRAIARDTKDYAAWGEAYQHLHVRTDVDWAFNQQNLGPTLFTDLSYDDVLVVGPAGTVTYAVIGGRYVATGFPLVGTQLEALVGQARAAAPNESQPVAGFLVDNGVPFLAAASVITTGGDPTLVPTAGPPSVLVLADALTPTRLGEIGDGGFVPGLRTPRDVDDARAGPARVIATADGSGSFRLRWDPDRPGVVLLQRVMPWFAVGCLAFALLSGMILRRAMQAAMLIEANTCALTEAHRQAEHSALHDIVTGLPNRLKLERFLDRHRGSSGQLDPLVLIYADLDRFKAINDMLGHSAGDEVLRQTAIRLQQVVGDGGIVARIGGDEFMIALPGSVPVDKIGRICARVIDAVRTPMSIEETTITIGSSLGVALAPADAQSPTRLIRNADLAMYQAKADGGNRYRFFSGDTTRRLSA